MNHSEESQIRSSVIVGEGWAALACVAHELTQTDRQVYWVSGTSSRLLSPLPSVGARGAAWCEVARWLGVSTGPWQPGDCLTEFKNREMKSPAWKRAGHHGAEVLEEYLWAPEQVLARAAEGRWERSFIEIEEEMRQAVLSHARLKHIEGVPLAALELEDGELRGVRLSTGEQVACDRLYYADRWSELSSVEGMPKGLPFTRKREPHGVFQATFTHSTPIEGSSASGLFCAIHKESGQAQERHVWGGFHRSLKGQPQSTWSVCLAPEENEDNHEIAKRFRRMKQALEKMFGATFTSSIAEEQVRLVEQAVFAAGDPPQGTLEMPRVSGVFFLTDAYGPAESLKQVWQALGLAPETWDASDTGRPPAQGQDADASSAALNQGVSP